MSAMPPVTAILLAGSRPGGDPLAQAAGVAVKPLVPVGGEPMINRPARALLAHPGIARVIVLAQDSAPFLLDPATAWLGAEPRIAFARSESGIAATLLGMIDSAPFPLIVTTADHVLLDVDMIDRFIAEARGADLAVAMVERRTMLARYPGSRRTWLKFRDGWWSGANLFWLGSAKVRTVIDLWSGVEQDRKKGWRVLAAFGPMLLGGAMLRVLSLRGGIARVGRRFGLDARLVAMPQAEACIDADKPDDVTLIETILSGRRGA